MGYRVTPKKHHNLLSDFITLLFEAQGKAPIFEPDTAELPLCWNRPENLDLSYIKYEWGHLHSINQNSNDAHVVRNLGLYPARCNQHIQASMEIYELIPYGGEI